MGKERLSIQFWLLCTSTFLFFASFNMIIPELPSYLTSLGGAEYKGLIISLFTLTAGLSRPFSGKLADTIGRIPVMVFGASICILAGIFYPLFATVVGFMALRLFHGLSTGFQPTGNSAYIADIVPVHRRGEAMGIAGIFLSVGIAFGPSLGGAIANAYSLDVMFYTSSAFGLLSVLVLVGMKESLPARQSFRLGLLKVKWTDVYEPRVLVPTIVMMLTTFATGIILTIIPDFSDYLGVKNKGLFFTYFTIASVMVRIIAGKISDKFGREVVLNYSTVGLAISMFVIGAATSPVWLMTGALLFGFSVGFNGPTLFAWTIDLAEDQYRGRAMSTIFIGLEIGIGVGAVFSGWYFANDPARFDTTFWSGGVLALVAFVFLMIRRWRRSRSSKLIQVQSQK